jgi:hypothetical protein
MTHYQTDQVIHFTTEKLQEQGKKVMIAQPKIEGWDYNDMLIREGLAAVKSSLHQAISYKSYRDQMNASIILKSEKTVVFDKRCAQEKIESLSKNFTL